MTATAYRETRILLAAAIEHRAACAEEAAFLAAKVAREVAENKALGRYSPRNHADDRALVRQLKARAAGWADVAARLTLEVSR